jgi:alpha-N-acetylgalactosaminidase
MASFLSQDLYEDVDYGILSPNTKIKVKVNPSGVVILRADVQPERFSKRPFNPYYT